MTNQGQAYLRTGGFLLKIDSMIGDTTQPEKTALLISQIENFPSGMSLSIGS